MILQSRTMGRLLAVLILGVAALAGPPISAEAVTGGAQALPLVGVVPHLGGSHASAPTDAQCRAALGVPCYSPQEIRRAYGLTGLLASGDNGRGQTIVIIDSYGSPTVAADLARFDADFGLPAPPSLKVLAPLGTVPFDANDPTQAGWAEETSLDVQWSHAMAPDARIVVMTSPVAETEGVQGLPQFLELEQYAVAHHLGNVISQSWAATENSLLTPQGESLIVASLIVV
ncbi:MAG TPA: hypothetical protein VK816_05650 [Jatrophihabitantaceae bacterium]|jgi:subtilase family serine protease|nr:hypothetical protein [Jatrophihabitantaceae bacterium]